MPLTRRTLLLLRAFREREAARGRGPRFKRAALALETEMHSQVISQAFVVTQFGTPALWLGDQESADWIYYFDHEEPGGDRSEWYFHFKDRRLFQSGFNHRGVNDFSRYNAGGELVLYDA